GMMVAGLLQLVFPGIFRGADEARSKEDWRKLVKRCDQYTFLFGAATVGGLLILSLVAPYLLGWLISDRYAASMPLLISAGLATAATQVNQVQYLLLQGQHNSAGMVKVMMKTDAIKTL